MNNKYLYYLADLPKIGNFRNKIYFTYYVLMEKFYLKMFGIFFNYVINSLKFQVSVFFYRHKRKKTRNKKNIKG